MSVVVSTVTARNWKSGCGIVRRRKERKESFGHHRVDGRPSAREAAHHGFRSSLSPRAQRHAEAVGEGSAVELGIRRAHCRCLVVSTGNWLDYRGEAATPRNLLKDEAGKAMPTRATFASELIHVTRTALQLG
jgi:hypothetical protein